MSFVFRKKGTLDLFLTHGPRDWQPIDHPQVIQYGSPHVSDEHGPMEPWLSRGYMVELSQAKLELEEHRLREMLVAPKPEPKTEPAPAPRAITLDKVRFHITGSKGVVDIETENTSADTLQEIVRIAREALQ